MDEFTGYMRIAVEEAAIGVRAGDGGPFGAVIVDSDGRVLAQGHNMVLATSDPTAHAEVVAIRRASESLNSPHLLGYTLFSTCEPCPMCLGAILWARIPRLVYASTRRDATEAGFDDERFYSAFGLPDLETVDSLRSCLTIIRCADADCDRLLREWASGHSETAY